LENEQLHYYSRNIIWDSQKCVELIKQKCNLYKQQRLQMCVCVWHDLPNLHCSLIVAFKFWKTKTLNTEKWGLCLFIDWIKDKSTDQITKIQIWGDQSHGNTNRHEFPERKHLHTGEHVNKTLELLTHTLFFCSCCSSGLKTNLPHYKHVIKDTFLTW